MPYTTYRSLPLEGLYDLLTMSVVDLLVLLETKKPNDDAVKLLRAQILAIVQLIGEKKNMQYKN